MQAFRDFSISPLESIIFLLSSISISRKLIATANHVSDKKLLWFRKYTNSIAIDDTVLLHYTEVNNNSGRMRLPSFNNDNGSGPPLIIALKVILLSTVALLAGSIIVGAAVAVVRRARGVTGGWRTSGGLPTQSTIWIVLLRKYHSYNYYL